MIEFLLERYEQLTHVIWEKRQWPDEHERGKKEIDCVADGICEGQRFRLAIEHTRIETYQKQSQDGAWFKSWVSPLEQELRGRWPMWLVQVELPYERDTPWSKETGRYVREWFETGFEKLPATGSRPVQVMVNGLLFPLVISKIEMVNGCGGVFFCRTVPPESMSDTVLDERMLHALQHKYERLLEYKQEGASAVMLLECQDIALTNQVGLYCSFLRASWRGVGSSLDQVWLACTFVGDGGEKEMPVFYCFRAGQELMAIANPENLLFHPRYDEYWRSKIK